MNRKQFAMCGAIVAGIIGAIVGYSVKIHNFILPLIAVTTGILILHLLRQKVDEVIEDERIYRISEKASRRVLEIFGIGSALIGMVLITSNSYAKVGYILAFSACVLLMFYLIFYSYYNRKGL